MPKYCENLIFFENTKIIIIIIISGVLTPFFPKKKTELGDFGGHVKKWPFGQIS